MIKRRLDEFLIGRGVAKDKNEAFILVTEGKVFVSGQKAISPAQPVRFDAKIEVRAGQLYVGRGAYKLEGALRRFNIDVKDKICVDIGASTGGFTEVLLKHGAQKVYAIDTARGKLALKLREDPRVVVMEGTDVRGVGKLPQQAELVTIDVSLISLCDILPHLGRFLKKEGTLVTLFKPQYETRDPKVLKHGVVRDDHALKKLLEDFIRWSKENNWEVKDWMESPIRGTKGNVEYLLWLRLS